FTLIHSGNRDPKAWKYFKQAYVSIKPKSWHGIELDAGEFVSPAGAEVIETNQNYNYSDRIRMPGSTSSRLMSASSRNRGTASSSMLESLSAPPGRKSSKPTRTSTIPAP